MGIKNDECKRVSALLALVLALSLLLLVSAAAPVQAGTATSISVYTHTDAECTDVTLDHKTHKAGGDHSKDYDMTVVEWKVWDGRPLHGSSSASAIKSGKTWAKATATQHVTMDRAWGTLRADTQADTGEWADARALVLADPVAGGRNYDIPLPRGLRLITTGSSWASVNITLWDDTDKERFPGFPLYAKYDPTATPALQKLGAWQKPWIEPPGKKGASYPPDVISTAVPEGHRIHQYVEVYAHVGGGGKAQATTAGPVGGTAFPVDKLALLAPYITLAIAVVAVAIGAVSARKRWTQKPVVITP